MQVGQRILLVLLALSGSGTARLLAQDDDGQSSPDVITLNKLPILDAPPERFDGAKPPAGIAPPPSPHPLLPAMKIAYNSYEFLTENVEDYSCRVVKQERINGRLRSMEYIDAKVRHAWRSNGRLVHPRSLYLKFLAPEDVAGREVLWVEGANDGKMIVRRGGRRFNYITVEIEPDSEVATRDSQYGLTDMGLKMMVRRLIEIGVEDMKYGECEVKFFRNVKVDDRPCLCIQVTHPKPREEFNFHIARIFVDNENPVPLRYEAYDWPESEGGSPVLKEQFTFQHLKLNVGFSDAEFRRDYSAYGFRE